MPIHFTFKDFVTVYNVCKVSRFTTVTYTELAEKFIEIYQVDVDAREHIINTAKAFLRRIKSYHKQADIPDDVLQSPLLTLETPTVEEVTEVAADDSPSYYKSLLAVTYK